MNRLNDEAKFLRSASICALTAGATTLLVAVPLTGPMKLSERLGIYMSPTYTRVLWVGIAHSLIVFLAHLGVGVLLARRSQLFAALGVLFSVLGMFTSLLTRSLILYVVSDPNLLTRYFTNPGARETVLG